MAGPGGGPPRRSHTKSRKGCKTCKRRHIRCDENFPQCRNCTKHNCRCDYMDTLIPEMKEPPPSPMVPNLMWTQDVEQQIEMWRQTDCFPFPELHLRPYPSPRQHSTLELRLLHHLCSICQELKINGASKLTAWTETMPTLLSLATESVFVMHSVLAFAATHLAWITDCSATKDIAQSYREDALKGLKGATRNLGRRNADLALAGSILLSWQVTEWHEWKSLMTDASNVIDMMRSWKQASHLADFIEKQPTFSCVVATSSIPLPFSEEQMDTMDIMGHRRVQNELDKVASIVAPNEEHKQAIQELGAFTGHLTKSFSTQNLADNFKLLQPLRSWLLWSPIRFLTPHHPDGSALVVLAHLYAVALAVEPWFSAVGAAYFGSMSVGPIEDIMETLNGLRASRRFNDDLQTLSDLMGFPLQMSFSFRDRMGWTQPNLDAEQTFSLPRSPFEGTLANLDLGPDSPGTDLIAEELHITYSQGSEWLITNSPPATPRPNASMRNRDSRSLDSHFPANISEVDASTFPGYEIVGGAPRYVEEEQGMCPYAMAAGLTGGFVPSALWT